MGTLGPLGPSGALCGPPKDARNFSSMSFLARIVLLILVCVQIAPRLRATHFSGQIEKDVVIERDLADLSSKSYFIKRFKACKKGGKMLIIFLAERVVQMDLQKLIGWLGCINSCKKGGRKSSAY